MLPALVGVERLSWQLFRRDRLGYRSLWILIAIAAFFVCAPFIANDRPLVIRFDGRLPRNCKGVDVRGTVVRCRFGLRSEVKRVGGQVTRAKKLTLTEL
jgi:hypothetical protein